MISADSRQFVEQRLGVFQIGGVETLGEPAIDPRQEVAGFGAPALLAPQPGDAHGGAYRQVAADWPIHVVLDNYATHKHPKVLAWLSRHPR
jgi:hypothetical protein